MRPGPVAVVAPRVRSRARRRRRSCVGWRFGRSVHPRGGPEAGAARRSGPADGGAVSCVARVDDARHCRGMSTLSNKFDNMRPGPGSPAGRPAAVGLIVEVWPAADLLMSVLAAVDKPAQRTLDARDTGASAPRARSGLPLDPRPLRPGDLDQPPRAAPGRSDGANRRGICRGGPDMIRRSCSATSWATTGGSTGARPRRPSWRRDRRRSGRAARVPPDVIPRRPVPSRHAPLPALEGAGGDPRRVRGVVDAGRPRSTGRARPSSSPSPRRRSRPSAGRPTGWRSSRSSRRRRRPDVRARGRPDERRPPAVDGGPPAVGRGRPSDRQHLRVRRAARRRAGRSAGQARRARQGDRRRDPAADPARARDGPATPPDLADGWGCPGRRSSTTSGSCATPT